MNIALDATYSAGKFLSGVGVYSREILSGLAAAHPDQQFLWCYRPHRLRRAFGESLPENARRVWLGANRLWPRSARLFHALNQRVDSRIARLIVATFHDLFVLTGEYSSAEFRARFADQARGAAERADLIIAVSHFTARQVVELLNVDASRVRVVHHGVHAPAGAMPDDDQRENLILHVGAIQTRKNVLRLIQAFETMPAGWRLALAGSNGYGAEAILSRIHNSPRRNDIEVCGYVDTDALEKLYRRARVFAFPSLDEGFGMPVLDAMSRGVPVLTSKGSALREISGDAAVLVEATDTEAIRDGLLRLTSEADLRDTLRAKGLEQARKFSWRTAVDETWAVYQELLRA